MANSTRLLVCLLALLAATPAGAVVQGVASSLGGYTVRLIGDGYCSGVVIGRRLIATAAHCAQRGVRVHGHGGSATAIAVTRSATLDDGRIVSASGDAAFLTLSKDLSGGAVATIGPGSGDTFTIAGYGTTDERWSGSFGTLHEAQLIPTTRFALVDPNRTSVIGASACFGDSGGPVMRGGELVGVITRAAHPWPRIACGDLTRWAPITVSGEATATVEVAARPSADSGSPVLPRRHARIGRDVKVSETRSFGLFWLFAPPPEPKSRGHKRTKTASR